MAVRTTIAVLVILLASVGGCRTPSTVVNVRVEKDLAEVGSASELARCPGKLVIGVTSAL